MASPTRSLESPTVGSTAFSPTGGASPSKQRHAHGWVTLAVGGKPLVTRQVTRLPAAVRQLHLQHWTRRAAIDSERERERAMIRDQQAEEFKAREARGLPTATPISPRPGSARTRNVPPMYTAYLNDIESDPRRIGFAFGGVYPGRLHAKGQLIERHEVNLSIGLCGEYLLHVRLRQPSGDVSAEELALPGSPFKLHVAPGAAHPLLTPLPPMLHGTCARTPQGGTPSAETVRAVRGGGSARFVCEHTLRACDKMGNKCIAGGAHIECGFLRDSGTPTQPETGTAPAHGKEVVAESSARRTGDVSGDVIGNDSGNDSGGLNAVCAAALTEVAAAATDASSASSLQTSCTDQGDGSYKLRWSSEHEGVFDIFVKMDGLHVLGSPSRLILAPPPPTSTLAPEEVAADAPAPVSRARRTSGEARTLSSAIEGGAPAAAAGEAAACRRTTMAEASEAAPAEAQMADLPAPLRRQRSSLTPADKAAAQMGEPRAPLRRQLSTLTPAGM